jgi:hypothetical protein
VFKNKENAGFFLSHDALGARRRGLRTGRPRTCTIAPRACEDVVAVRRAATGGTCCADRFRCTHPSSTAAFQRKNTKEPLSWQVLFFLTALQLPSRSVHCWRAWSLSFGSFEAKSPSTIFLTSWGNTRRENRLNFFFPKMLVKYCTGGKEFTRELPVFDPDLSMAISNTQSSQVEFADWLGVISTARRRRTFFFHKKTCNPALEKLFSKKLEQTRASKRIF